MFLFCYFFISSSLFGTPGISITTLIIDHNPMLRNVVVSNNYPFPSWIQILQAIAQPASAVVSLTIDLPESKFYIFMLNNQLVLSLSNRPRHAIEIRAKSKFIKQQFV